MEAILSRRDELNSIEYFFTKHFVIKEIIMKITHWGILFNQDPWKIKFSAGQNSRYFTDNIFVNTKNYILIKSSLKFVPVCPIDSYQALI